MRTFTLLFVISFGGLFACGDAESGSGATQGSGGGAGGGDRTCSAMLDKSCGADAFCRYDDGGFCGGSDASGVCLPRPDTCAEDCSEVCGCDGQIYCNACQAQMAGVDVSSSTACLTP
jgi:hypothetical protein